MQILHISETPNPLARKFHADALVTQGKALSYSDVESAADFPAAKALFALPLVRGVFVMDQVITVSLAHGADWDEMIPEITMVLEEYLEPMDHGETSAPTAPLVKPENFFALELESQVSHIEAVFDAKVRPGLAGDGGGLELMGIDGTTVYILYVGACGSCPSSTTGTLNYIRQTLREWIHPEIEVELA